VDLTLIDPAGGVHAAGQMRNVRPPGKEQDTEESSQYRAWRFELKDPPPGVWKIQIKETKTPVPDAARLLIFTLQSSSAVKAALVGLERTYAKATPVTIGLIASSKATPKSVEGTVQLGGREPETLEFRDNGEAPDAKASDGLFTAAFTPAEAGDYLVSAIVSGETEDGHPFVRTVAGHLRAAASCGVLPPDFHSELLDTNANNRPDTLAVSLAPQMTSESPVHLEIELAAAESGARVRAFTDASSLPEGSSQRVEVRFDQRALAALGENGPYKVTSMSLSCIRPDQEYFLSDVRMDPGSTVAVSLDATDRPDILLTGANTERLVDTNNNGRADRLEFSVGIDAVAAGSVLWSATLSAVNGGGPVLDIAEGSAQITAGRGTLTLTFDGAKIGRARINGPYVITNLLINRSGGVVIEVPTAGRTQAYEATRFEGNP
jgi:hypothetical protein